MLTRIRRDDGGYVLVVVMLSMILVLTLITGVMSYAVGSRDLSARDQDWNAALAAAEAGLDDYLFHLNQDSSYWHGNNVTTPASCASTGEAPPAPGNPAFTTWVPIPGEVSDASFRYSVLCRPQQTGNGSVTLAATGRVGTVTRTVSATLRRRNFLDYLYFTDFETKDPAAYDSGDDLTPQQAGAPGNLCTKYYWEGRDPNCTEITFISQDTINGPLHSNDALRINGTPHFNGDTSSNYQPASGNRWVSTPGSNPNPDTPVVATAGDPRYADRLTMPPSNTDIKNETNPALGGTGCLFTGPTAIRMNNNGTIDVISPFTKVVYCTSPTWAASPDFNLNGEFTSTRFTIPSTGGVVYVQNVPTTGDNATAGCPFSRPAIGGNGGSGPVPNRTHPLGFPQKNDITPSDPNLITNGYGAATATSSFRGR